ncbi:PHP domain-containing protein [Propionibacteriaceae bacterium Y1700]|uniref:PHP domain-containing protein n=1 Tax=Microlunatus sp. Y1700 TaxID=3418487 RepID=UPI003DA73AC1
MRIDLHTHSNTSDGTQTPTELVAAAKAAGLDVVALTDHDTFDGLPEAQRAADEVGLHLVRGMEMSCRHDGHSVHLLAYGADPHDAALGAELDQIREGRTGRLGPVLEKLKELGVGVTEEQVRAQVGDSPSVGRPHIADAMVAAGHVRDRTEAFNRFLADGGPAHVPRYAAAVEQAIDLVHGAGGAAVLAHPWGRGRQAQLTADFIARLAHEHGLDGIEVDHQDHDQHARQLLRILAGDNGLVMTGSSDHHGLGKVDHELGCNTTAEDQFSELMSRVEVHAARR